MKFSVLDVREIALTSIYSCSMIIIAALHCSFYALCNELIIVCYNISDIC